MTEDRPATLDPGEFDPATLRPDDRDLLPERVGVPDACCVRVCDRPAETVAIAQDATELRLYGFCATHRDRRGEAA